MSYGISMGPNTHDWFMKQLDKIVRRMNREERKRKKAPAINPKFKSTIVMAEIYAISPITGELTTYGGPNIPALSKSLAHDFCQNSGIGYGYCHVTDEIIMEIPCKKGSFEPDFANAVDYDIPEN